MISFLTVFLSFTELQPHWSHFTSLIFFFFNMPKTFSYSRPLLCCSLWLKHSSSRELFEWLDSSHILGLSFKYHIPQNIAAWNNTDLLFRRSVDHYFRSGLVEWFWLKVSHEVVVCVSKSRSHLNAWQGLELQNSSLIWLLAGCLSFLPCGTLHRATWKSSQHGNWLLSEWSKRENKEKISMPFMT